MFQELKNMDLTGAIAVLEQRKRDMINDFEDDIIRLKDDIKAIEEERDITIASIDLSLSELRKINTVCEYCKGEGDVRETDAAGDTDWVTCRHCKGTGKSNQI